MTEIIIPGQKDPHDVDACKQCEDFVPLNDGTIHGDKKYCDVSTHCRQFNPVTKMGYYSEFHEWYELYTDEDSNVRREKCRDYLCTGKYPIWEERSEDSKAS